MIECGCCGKHYQHKVNNSGKKWRNDIWACATQLRKVIVQRWTVTFVFYNGVEITRAYTNGPSGNQVGWKQKKEVAAWQ